MKLVDWLEREGITRRDFGSRVGLSPSSMSDLCRGRQFVSARVALAIERETKGEVTVRDILQSYREDQERAA